MKNVKLLHDEVLIDDEDDLASYYLQLDISSALSEERLWAMQVTIDGRSFEIEHSFSETRAIINYDGLHVIADKDAQGWDLSGEPASPAEEVVLKTFTKPTDDVSMLTVIKE